MGAVASRSTAKGRVSLPAAVVLLGMLLPVAVQGASRRSLALTALDLRTGQRGSRLVSIGRLRAAVTEHLELMGETVKSVDNTPNSRRCVTRECQLALAQERQTDILYGDIEQTSETTYMINLWLWRFDFSTNAPITEYPVSAKDTCTNCDESSLTQKLLELTGYFIEQKLEPSVSADLKLPSNTSAFSSKNRDSSKWQLLSSKRKVAVAVLSTICGISLVSAVSLTAVQGMGRTLLADSGSAIGGNQPTFVALQINLTPFFGAAYGISAAAGAGLLTVLLW